MKHRCHRYKYAHVTKLQHLMKIIHRQLLFDHQLGRALNVSAIADCVSPNLNNPYRCGMCIHYVSVTPWIPLYILIYSWIRIYSSDGAVTKCNCRWKLLHLGFQCLLCFCFLIVPEYYFMGIYFKWTFVFLIWFYGMPLPG